MQGDDDCVAIGMVDMECTWCFPEGGVEGFLNWVGDGEWWNHGAIGECGFGSA